MRVVKPLAVVRVGAAIEQEARELFGSRVRGLAHLALAHDTGEGVEAYGPTLARRYERRVRIGPRIEEQPGHFERALLGLCVRQTAVADEQKRLPLLLSAFFRKHAGILLQEPGNVLDLAANDCRVKRCGRNFGMAHPDPLGSSPLVRKISETARVDASALQKLLDEVARRTGLDARDLEVLLDRGPTLEAVLACQRLLHLPEP